jgi:CHAT domain-containing protein
VSYFGNAPGKAQALQQAQKTLRYHSDYDHPYYWSAFILIGDWR